MSFDPRDFIKLSKELQNGSTEAHYRITISRAYYGVFGHIRNKLQISNMSQSVHRDVIHNLKESVHQNEKKIGKRLEIIFKKRKDADYKYNITIAKNTCDFALKDAEEILEIFNERP